MIPKESYERIKRTEPYSNRYEFGSVDRMPTPSEDPIKVGYNREALNEALKGGEITYLELSVLSQYGVYYSTMFLIGDRTWVTYDRIGTVIVRTYEKPFTTN